MKIDGTKLNEVLEGKIFIDNHYCIFYTHSFGRIFLSPKLCCFIFFSFFILRNSFFLIILKE